jgi:phosphomannomutase
MNEINENIFKTYDIRGVYKEELTEEAAYKIGRAVVTFLKKENPTIVLGRDGRTSSPFIFEAVKKGVLDSGGNVINIGVSNTPLLNFSVAKFNHDAGLMITASHNPANFNGIKIIKEKALQVYGEEIQLIKNITKREDFKSGKGEEKAISFLAEYINHIFSFAEKIEGLKVIFDFGNGVGAVTAKPLFSRLKVETIYLFEDIDGTFPNHLPDPTNLMSSLSLKEKIRETKADIGVLFDGDADRCVLMDEKGEIVKTDHLLSLLAVEELKTHKKGTIYYDLRFSMAVAETIKENGGNPVAMRVGNPYYKEKIINEGGILGAELSGHIMYKENFGIDDGLFALIKTLNILQKEKKKLSSLLYPFKKYFQTEEINIEVENKKETIEKVREIFSDGEELFIDGVYVSYKDWWFNLRESNTENLLRLRIEATTEELLKEKREKLISLISSAE